VENFQRRKTWCQNTTSTTQFTTNLPAIYHVPKPQNFRNPLKNTSKSHGFSPPTTPEKNHSFAKKLLA
jgi:hypothetical protein